eukprot:6206337-Alexandrium_andersonii.AAC.1
MVDGDFDPNARKVRPTKTESPRPTATTAWVEKTMERSTTGKVPPTVSAPPEDALVQEVHEEGAADRSARQR